MAKDIVCHVWRLAAQGPKVSEIWKDSWAAFQAGRSPLRIMIWKEAVEMLTDIDVKPEMYQLGRNNPFPLGTGGHVHRTNLAQTFDKPAKEIFEKNGCIEAWESLHNDRALRVWTDASVMAKGAAAAVLVESCNPPQRGNEMLQRIQRKNYELDLEIDISHVDGEYEGRVQGECLRCHKTFDVYIRTYISRGPTKCFCEVRDVTLAERVKEKADTIGCLEILRVEEGWKGKVQGRCKICNEPFAVATRTFLYRGPPKCKCAKNRATTNAPMTATMPHSDDMDAEDSDEGGRPPPRPPAPPLVIPSPPSSIFCFPVRGNSFRSEGLGLVGAKRLLIERGNLERKDELHILCDNKANIELQQQMQKDLSRLP